jgi:DNA mismatch repair protein MutL
MGNIVQLSGEIVAKIAAGEVIERPASVVKELIENSLDAGASSIKIVLEKSGLNKITVVDNGSGMSRDDLSLAALPHTTSKILQAEDLLTIKTLGFRGEALASIAQISHLTIKSRMADDDFGCETKINGGQIQDFRTTGMPAGTSVIVENLFYSVPVRKKFLKSLATEFRYLVETITAFALAHPKIKFSLTHNNRVLFDLPAQQLEFRLRSLLGSAVYNNFVPIQYNDPYFQISGFVAKPQIARRSKQKQYLFINQRIIEEPILSKVIKDSYHELLKNNEHPPFVIFLEIPAENIDVNVHPRKTHIRFIDPLQIQNLTQRAIEKSLSHYDLTFNKQFSHYQHHNQPSYSQQTARSPQHLLKDSSNQLNQTRNDSTDQNSIQDNEGGKILQLNHLYLITIIDNQLFMIDQHAAHEKILFEQYRQAYNKQKHKRMKLKKAIQIELAVTDVQVVNKHSSKIKKLGFRFKKSKSNIYQIVEIPLILEKLDLKKAFIEIIDQLRDNERVVDFEGLLQNVINYLSCRGAIKAGEYLSQDQREELIKELLSCENPYTCPHGRPTIIKASMDELDKMFRRS